MARLVSLGVVLSLIIALGVTFFKVVAPFLLPLFLAGIATLLLQPAYGEIFARVGNRKGVAAGITTALVMAVILVPGILGVIVASKQMVSVGSTTVQAGQQLGNVGRQAGRVVDVVIRKSAEAFVDVQDRLPESLRVRLPDSGDAGPLKFDALEADDTERPDVLSDATPSNTTTPSAEGPPEADPTTAEADTAETDTAENDTAESDSPEADTDPSPEADPDELTEVPDESDAAPAVTELTPAEREQLVVRVEREIRDRGQDLMIELGQRSLGAAGKTISGTLDVLQTGLGALFGAVIGLSMFGIGLFYFLADGPAMVRATRHLVPVQTEYQERLLNQFSTVVRSVVLATFAAAIVQAMMCVAALWLCGFSHLVILFVLALISSMIPLAGTYVVWAPCAAYLAYSNQWVAAALLTVWGAGAIGVADNVVRTYVLGSQTKLHPLLAFVSVLGGLQVLGLWGVFVGPIVASCLHGLIEIFNQEIGELSRETFAKERDLLMPNDPPPEEPEAPPVTAEETPQTAAAAPKPEDPPPPA